MKNNTVRIQRKTVKKAPSSQVKMGSGKCPVAAPQPAAPGIKDGAFSGDERVSLLLHDRCADGFIAGADVSPAAMKEIRAKALRCDMSFGDLLKAALGYLVTDFTPPSGNESTGGPVKAAASAGDKAHPSRVTPRTHKVKLRPVGYDWVSEFIDDYQRLEFSRDETGGLLALGASLLRLQARDDAGSKVADDYAGLVSGANQKMRIAVNTISECVFHIEPRTQDPWKTPAEMEVAS